MRRGVRRASHREEGPECCSLLTELSRDQPAQGGANFPTDEKNKCCFIPLLLQTGAADSNCPTCPTSPTSTQLLPQSDASEACGARLASGASGARSSNKSQRRGPPGDGITRRPCLACPIERQLCGRGISGASGASGRKQLAVHLPHLVASELRNWPHLPCLSRVSVRVS